MISLVLEQLKTCCYAVLSLALICSYFIVDSHFVRMLTRFMSRDQSNVESRFFEPQRATKIGSRNQGENYSARLWERNLLLVRVNEKFRCSYLLIK